MLDLLPALVNVLGDVLNPVLSGRDPAKDPHPKRLRDLRFDGSQARLETRHALTVQLDVHLHVVGMPGESVPRLLRLDRSWREPDETHIRNLEGRIELRRAVGARRRG